MAGNATEIRNANFRPKNQTSQGYEQARAKKNIYSSVVGHDRTRTVGTKHQDKQCTERISVTLRHVTATVIAVKKKQ